VVNDRFGAPLTDDEAAALLGAYALDACEPDEAAEVEAVLARRPDLALEATRLARVASWLGAAEAVEPQSRVRDAVLGAALDRRAAAGDPVVDVYVAFSDGFADAVAALPADALDVVTANGLTARELVVHMAAQESLLAQQLGTPTVADLPEEDVDARTAALLPRFAERSVADALELWRSSVDVNRGHAVAETDRDAIWPGLGLTRDDTLLVRAFEAWIHADDLRVAAGASPVAPPAPELAVMSDFARRILPLALTVADREHPGRTARLVLTGAGGGDWLVPLGAGEPDARADVTLTVDVLDWCRLVGDRIAPGALPHRVDGDEALALDLVAGAPALATL
jgi:uncharacterized protein (TIGR03083 family)